MQRTLISSSSKRSRTLQPGSSRVLVNLTTLLRCWKNCAGSLLNHRPGISPWRCAYFQVYDWLHSHLPLIEVSNTWWSNGRMSRSSQLLQIPLFKARSGQRTFYYRIVSVNLKGQFIRRFSFLSIGLNLRVYFNFASQTSPFFFNNSAFLLVTKSLYITNSNNLLKYIRKT